MKLISVCALMFLLSGCSERFTEYYPRYDDAVKAGAVKRGWVPEFIPETATEIHEHHDLDTNHVWIMFVVPNLDRDRMVAGFKRLEDEEIEKVRVRRPSRVSWWFYNLIQQAPADDGALNAEIYVVSRHENMTAYVALDRTGPRVYYWRTND